MTTRIVGRQDVYKGWSTITKVELEDGHGSRFFREVEHHGVAVAVLPYDPHRRVALMVQMPRTPVMLSGAEDDLLEAPAGILDAGEEPEACARREAFEEAGVELGVLEPLGTLWTCPGVSTERITLFLAPYAAGSRTASGGGLAEENENISVSEQPLDRLAALLEAGELTDMKTFCLVQALRFRHPALFGTRG